ncbi:MAG: hypothetical protein HZB55_01425 [Deltaproteobacteria bacterium]|nr:hypothetical protein [Deltaproteobacteria bacterium]
MKNLLFACPPEFNAKGVCRASSGVWLRYSRTRSASGGVQTLNDLGQPSFFKLIWDDPASDDGIDHVNLLGNSVATTTKSGAFTGADVANALVSRLGEYCLIAIWGAKEGHSMAAITIDKYLRFFDPNFGCWTFDTTAELKDHVGEHLSILGYADLLRNKYIIRRWK